MNANIAPTFAGIPSSARIFNTVPDAGAGISVSTLSVFTSSSGSSSFTESPSFLSHLITVTSSTPSPNNGTSTFVAIRSPFEPPSTLRSPRKTFQIFALFAVNESQDNEQDQLRASFHTPCQTRSLHSAWTSNHRRCRMRGDG